MRSRFVGELLNRRRGTVVRDLFSDDEPLAVSSRGRKVPAGSIVEVHRTPRGATVKSVLARPRSPRAGLYAICREHGLNPIHSDAVMAEVERMLRRPGIRDQTLADRRSLPFVTIDGPGTRDLDQALFIEGTKAGGFVVHYAIADASHPVPVGSALFDEALRRGSSFYLPGMAVPMLPRELSEGITSLGPRADRRALVFSFRLDKQGRVTRTRIERARIRSRAQLTFDDVELFLATGKGPLPKGVADSLKALRRVGELRIADAQGRDVIHYRRSEMEFKIGREGMHFVVRGGPRSDVERYNEQLSLLCNIEGAKFLKKHRLGPDMQAIFRVHPAPDAKRYGAFESLLARLCKTQRLDPERWRWTRKTGSLATFLRELPTEGREGRIAQAVHRQAVMLNYRSTFSNQADRHFGVGAEVYARFSAPMREIVGVYVHKEAIDRLENRRSEVPIIDGRPVDDDELRARVVRCGNESRALQKQITKDANRLVLDRLFGQDSKRPRKQRPVRRGTVMGLQATRAHILLDDPPVEVKVYARYVERRLRTKVSVSKDGVSWLRADERRGGVICRLGDEVELRVHDRDERGDRWMFLLDRRPSG